MFLIVEVEVLVDWVELLPQTARDEEVDQDRVQIHPTLTRVRLGVVDMCQEGFGGISRLHAKPKQPMEVDECDNLPGWGILPTEVDGHRNPLVHKIGAMIKPAAWPWTAI